ncbi:MAG: cytochrome c [bacterium]
MPNFRLSEKESLALTLFLEKQAHVTEQELNLSSELDLLVNEARKQSSASTGQSLINQYECTKCHRLGDVGENQSVDLATVGFRLKPDWTKKYMAAPYLYDGLQTKMPSYFYAYDARRKKNVEMLPQPAQRIDELTKYLFSLNTKKQAELRRTYEKARIAHPEVDPALGEMIFFSLNCVACHKFAGALKWSGKNAPDLRFEGVRVKREWLRAYLNKPTSVRPFGFHPGSGSRMPDFDFSEKEIEVLTDYFFDQKGKFESLSQTFEPRKLSTFAMTKARTLLSEKLPCLGCHRLGRSGGKIAPDLSNLKLRLQKEFVSRMVEDPQSLVPGTIMPKIKMPKKTFELVISYLVQQELPREDSHSLSLVDNPIHFYQDENTDRGLYSKYCASCHGVSGGGDGFNAKYLETRPAKLSDSVYLSGRPDDTLFDGIFAGGYILNKSHLMPPWGHTLDKTDIWHLVSYIRKLCNCNGPYWSTDNK